MAQISYNFRKKIWPNTASDSKVLPIFRPGVMGISRFMRNPMRSSFSSEMVKGQGHPYHSQ